MMRRNRQHGVAAIEFSILLVPLITIVFGITELGRAVYQYNIVAKATRDAARYLTTQKTGDATALAVATCLVKYGKYSSTCSNADPLLAPGLASAKISVCNSANCSKDTPIPAINNDSQGSNPVINMVTVTVGNYQFQSSLLPFVNTSLATITFNNISTTLRTQL